MKQCVFPRRLAVATLLLAGVTAGAHANQSWSSLDGLSACPAAFTDTASPKACLLVIDNADIEGGQMGQWAGFDQNQQGVSLVAPDPRGQGYAIALPRADVGVTRTVRLPDNVGNVGGTEATYVLRFRSDSDGDAPVRLHYRLRIVDAAGNHLENVTESVVTTAGGEDQHAIRLPSRHLPGSAFLAVEFIRGEDESFGLSAYVDDIAVILRDRR